MGITGLLPFFTPKMASKHLSHFKNKRVGIDGHMWLYKICSVMSMTFLLGKKTDRHLTLLYKKIKPLLDNKVTPIFVFDGNPLPSKKVTNDQRSQQKQSALTKFEQAKKKNNKAEMYLHARQCVSINKEIMDQVYRFLDKHNIEYINSPYETDAQLLYLQNINYIDCIITEDSDLIVYGCDNILYKYDNDKALLYTKDQLYKALPKFFADNLRAVCVLSGCDYLKSVKGVGLKSAMVLLKQYETVEKVIEALKEKNKEVPEDYLEGFARAMKTFDHQVVYDPIKDKRVHLCGSDVDMELEFLGSLEDNKNINNNNKDNVEICEILVSEGETSPYFSQK